MKSPLLALALALPASAQSDWPQYNGASGDRRSAEVVTLVDWPDAGPPRVWEVPANLGFSSFTVANGRAYTLVTREIAERNLEVCIALDVATGEELWATPIGSATPEYDGGGGAGADDNKGGDGPRSTPSHSGNRVYTLDAELVLAALDDATGETMWTQDVGRDYDGRNIRWQNAASPLVEGDRVFVAGGGPGVSLIAFDKNTGEEVWAVGDELMTHATPVAATIHDVRQVIFFVQYGLVAVDPESGDELWRAEYPYKVSSAASPVVYGDVVYVSAGYGVGGGAFRVSRSDDAFSTELLWQTRNKQINHWSTPVCIDGFLYGMFSFKKYGEGPLKCVDIETGETKWESDGFGPGNCIAVGEHIVALSDAGDVVLVEANPEAYAEIARAEVLTGKCWSSPAFVDGQLYLRSTDVAVRLDLSASVDR
jgi:outer membrane protein assembly factor BamB